MSLSSLTPSERQIVFECLRAASDGPFFPEWEFATLFGLKRDVVRRISAAAPDIDDSREDVAVAINNAMNNLLGYPHNQEAVWSQYISASPAETNRIFSKWRGTSDEK